jgi:hypothetical protein
VYKDLYTKRKSRLGRGELNWASASGVLEELGYLPIVDHNGGLGLDGKIKSYLSIRACRLLTLGPMGRDLDSSHKN